MAQWGKELLEQLREFLSNLTKDNYEDETFELNWQEVELIVELLEKSESE